MGVFDDFVDGWQERLEHLPQHACGLFLLATAERHEPVFSLFEQRARRGGWFRGVLDRAWRMAELGALDPTLASDIENGLPSEDWTIDGFHDAIAQYVGGLLQNAVEMLAGNGAAVRPYGAGIWDALRIIHSEARLSCLEPPDDDEGHAFEHGLLLEPLVKGESAVWDEFLALVQAGKPVSLIEQVAKARQFQLSRIEADLARGLAADGI